MRVEVSGYRLLFPPSCACCGDAPETMLQASVTNQNARPPQTKTWQIPYCSSCRRHVELSCVPKDRPGIAPWWHGIDVGPCLILLVLLCASISSWVAFVVAFTVFIKYWWLPLSLLCVLAVVFARNVHKAYQSGREATREVAEHRYLQERREFEARRLMKPGCICVGRAVAYFSVGGIPGQLQYRQLNVSDQFAGREQGFNVRLVAG